jgi:hypothetical protein
MGNRKPVSPMRLAGFSLGTQREVLPARQSDRPRFYWKETVQERRRQHRIEINEVAYIFGDGSSTCCRVVDITEHGAAIELPVSAGHSMRDRFKLMIAKDRVDRNCRLIWRSGSRIGVEFTD